MLLDLFAVFSVKYIFYGLEKSELLSFRNLVRQAAEHAVHILPDIPTARIITVLVSVVPDQSTLEHGNAALLVHCENRYLGVCNDTEKLLSSPFGIELGFYALMNIRTCTCTGN